MRESARTYFMLESPAPGAILPAGRHWLRGWVLPKTGGHFVDVRARVKDRFFAAVHGLPRADLAAFFKTGRAHALAEFTVAIELIPGPVEVILEALDLDGQWREFTRVGYQIDPAYPPVDFGVPSGPLRWHEFGRMVEWLLRRQRRHPGTPVLTLARQLVATVPYPRDLRHAHPPLVGHLDEPAAVARTALGRSPLLGWLFHQTQPIRRVLATFDLHAWQTVEHTRPSPHIGAHFSRFPQAQHCALAGFIDVPAQLPDPLCIRVYAELADGSLHLGPVQRSLSLTGEDEKTPYPPRDSADFHSSLTTLRAALAERGMAVVEDDDLKRELARLEADFGLRAPRSLPRPTPLKPSPASSAARAPQRVLLATHNLNLEGAPLFLIDYARHLVANGAAVTVLSPAEGALHGRFTALGAEVRMVEAGGIVFAPSPEAAQTEIQRLGREVDFASFDLVVGSTFTTFWAIHAAKRASRPALLYVHESTTPATFYRNRANPGVISLVEESFALADAVSFTSISTRRYHLDYGRPERHRLTPGWIEVERIDHWLAQNPRDKLRARFDLPPDGLLVTNIGTFCERKGQHIFARAVDLLWRRNPTLAARTRFVMLGGGASTFDESLADLRAQLDRPNLIVHPSTPDYFPYYAAADLFVCSTYEESSPRVILEAMACGTPIISSDVHGIPELVRSPEEATLVPAGDTLALCDAMSAALASPATARAQAARARRRVEAEFSATRVLPRHLALAAEVAAGRA
jgi:glycosyltransferase involved in cell wall biosynthesis